MFLILSFFFFNVSLWLGSGHIFSARTLPRWWCILLKISHRAILCPSISAVMLTLITLTSCSGSPLCNYCFLSLTTDRQSVDTFVVVVQSCPTLCNPMDCSRPGFPVLRYLTVLAQTHVHWVDDAIQPSHPLPPPSPPALSLSQYQGLFQSVGSLHQSFQWTFRVGFL